MFRSSICFLIALFCLHGTCEADVLKSFLTTYQINSDISFLDRPQEEELIDPQSSELVYPSGFPKIVLSQEFSDVWHDISKMPSYKKKKILKKLLYVYRVYIRFDKVYGALRGFPEIGHFYSDLGQTEALFFAVNRKRNEIILLRTEQHGDPKTSPYYSVLSKYENKGLFDRYLGLEIDEKNISNEQIGIFFNVEIDSNKTFKQALKELFSELKDKTDKILLQNEEDLPYQHLFGLITEIKPFLKSIVEEAFQSKQSINIEEIAGFIHVFANEKIQEKGIRFRNKKKDELFIQNKIKYLVIEYQQYLKEKKDSEYDEDQDYVSMEELVKEYQKLDVRAKKFAKGLKIIQQLQNCFKYLNMVYEWNEMSEREYLSLSRSLNDVLKKNGNLHSFVKTSNTRFLRNARGVVSAFENKIVRYKKRIDEEKKKKIKKLSLGERYHGVYRNSFPKMATIIIHEESLLRKLAIEEIEKDKFNLQFNKLKRIAQINHVLLGLHKLFEEYQDYDLQEFDDFAQDIKRTIEGVTSLDELQLDDFIRSINLWEIYFESMRNYIDDRKDEEIQKYYNLFQNIFSEIIAQIKIPFKRVVPQDLIDSLIGSYVEFSILRDYFLFKKEELEAFRENHHLNEKELNILSFSEFKQLQENQILNSQYKAIIQKSLFKKTRQFQEQQAIKYLENYANDNLDSFLSADESIQEIRKIIKEYRWSGNEEPIYSSIFISNESFYNFLLQEIARIIQEIQTSYLYNERNQKKIGVVYDYEEFDYFNKYLTSLLVSLNYKKSTELHEYMDDWIQSKKEKKGPSKPLSSIQIIVESIFQNTKSMIDMLRGNEYFKAGFFLIKKSKNPYQNSFLRDVSDLKNLELKLNLLFFITNKWLILIDTEDNYQIPDLEQINDFFREESFVRLKQSLLKGKDGNFQDDKDALEQYALKSLFENSPASIDILQKWKIQEKERQFIRAA